MYMQELNLEATYSNILTHDNNTYILWRRTQTNTRLFGEHSNTCFKGK